MPIYKVVEKKQKSLFKGRMTSDDLEEPINSYAREGWTLDRIVAGETARFMGLGEKDSSFSFSKKKRCNPDTLPVTKP